MRFRNLRMGKLIILLCFVLLYPTAQAQHGPRNLILVTLDGVRWQELFQGADSSLLFDRKLTSEPALLEEFWAPDPAKRREKLMPFMWKTVADHGQLYGNRSLNNRVNCANTRLFSYPGYSEMLVGFVDRKARSNDKVENPNSTVLEFINNDSTYHKKVAVFSTWDVIPYIAGCKTCLYYNFKEGNNLAGDMYLRVRLQNRIRDPENERPDLFTFDNAFTFLKHRRPHVLFISFDETDEHGHAGRYGEYLRSAHRIDEMISELWDWIQADPQYKDNTTLVVTTDHGRGSLFRNSWKKHGIQYPGSSQIWIGLIGPDIPQRGEVSTNEKYYQKQIAKTLASILGLDYTNIKPVAKEIESVLYKPLLTLK